MNVIEIYDTQRADGTIPRAAANKRYRDNLSDQDRVVYIASELTADGLTLIELKPVQADGNCRISPGELIKKII